MTQYEKQIVPVQFKTNDQSKNFNNYIEKAVTILGKKKCLIATPNLISKLSPSVTLSKSPLMRRKLKEIAIENFDLKLSIVENDSNYNCKDQRDKNITNSNKNDYYIENGINTKSSIIPANKLNNLSIANNNDIKNKNEKSISSKSKVEFSSTQNNLLSKIKSNTIWKSEKTFNEDSSVSSKKLLIAEINVDAEEMTLLNNENNPGSTTERENMLMMKMKSYQLSNNILNFKNPDNQSEDNDKFRLEKDFAKKNFGGLNLNCVEDPDEDDQEIDIVNVKGYLYKLTDINKMKKLWFNLYQKDLYCKFNLLYI